MAVGIAPTSAFFALIGITLYFQYGNSYCALYTGLLSENEWIPEGRQPGWALSASDLEVEKLICAKAQESVSDVRSKLGASGIQRDLKIAPSA